MGEKIIEQQQAIKLRARGLSINEITKKLGVSKSSISVWIRNIPLSETQLDRLKQRELQGAEKGRQILHIKWKKYRETHPLAEPNIKLQKNRQRISTFFDNWTPDMAYVLGFFAADGCMYHSRNGGFYNGGYYFEFLSTDQELIATIKELMDVINKIEIMPKPNQKRRIKYKLRIVNKTAFRRLLKLGFTPNKSLTLSFPKVPTAYFAHFVRGYFDGDGCIYIGQSKGKNILQTKFTSGSRKFLDVLQRRLHKEATIGPGSLHPHSSNWELSYSGHDTRQLYQFLYSTDTVPCLQRKRLKFEQAFKILDPWCSG